MKNRHFFMLFGLCFSLFLIACGGGETATQEETAPETDVPAKEVPAEQKYTLTPFAESTSYPDAKIESMSYEGGKFSFGVVGTDYKLGEQTPDAAQKMCANSGKGQHIHLIIDNAPYAAKYTADFEYEVADGKHFLLAFLSRSYHESIKTADAHVLKEIKVKDNGIFASEDFSGKMLNYSRPKGTYVGKENTEKVMLDFYLNNVEIGTDFFVDAKINGEKHRIEKWQPYYITGLPMGENTVELTLVDKDGNQVSAPHNPVTRTFTLKADPADPAQ